MARYYPVSPLFWSDSVIQSFLREHGDAPALLAAYFLTCEHRNLEGLYRLPMTYVAADLLWDREKVEKTMDLLVNEGFIEYDPEAQVVFVKNALKYQAPKTAKQVQGAITALQAVPPTPLLERLKTVANAFAPEFAMALGCHSDAINSDGGEVGQTHA